MQTLPCNSYWVYLNVLEVFFETDKIKYMKSEESFPLLPTNYRLGYLEYGHKATLNVRSAYTKMGTQPL